MNSELAQSSISARRAKSASTVAEGFEIASPVYHHLPLFDGPLTPDPESASRLRLADRYFLIAERAKVPDRARRQARSPNVRRRPSITVRPARTGPV